jgi:hypothetical protein
MSACGTEEGVARVIPLTIIPLTSLRPCPSFIAHLHVRFGCGFPRCEIRGSIPLGCGGPHWSFPRQKHHLQKISKKTVDKN